MYKLKRHFLNFLTPLLVARYHMPHWLFQMRYAQVAYTKLVTKPVFVDTKHNKINTP